MKPDNINTLYADICNLLEAARKFLANSANKTITLMYWKIGERINNELLDGKRLNMVNKFCRS
jgi:hypothetical protein